MKEEFSQMDQRHLGDPGTPDFQLERYPFYLLNRTVSRYNAVIEGRLRAISLDIPAWRVLMILGEHNPRGIREVAEAAVINLSTMTRIVQRMAGVGLVRTRASKADQRVTEVILTAAGKDKLAEARETTAPIYAGVIKGLSEREFVNLLSLLDRLHGNLGEFERRST
jgi:DNA-binding MarR family transcriptional regulator